jgi:peptide deformylase
MSERSIILYPNPFLRRICKPVEAISEETKIVIADLWDTLDAHTGVGLSAPQIGFDARIIVVDATRARRPVKNHGRLTLINPELCLVESTISFREGCMSIPDLVAHVPRADRIIISATLPDGSPVTIDTHGFEAVVIQHELDHLDGVLFIDRVKSARDIKPRLNPQK